MTGCGLEVETAEGCPKRQELKQEKFFEFCLGRLETIFYAIFPLCSAAKALALAPVQAS